MNATLTPDRLEDEGIDTVIVAGVDMQGRLFGKRMNPRSFERAIERGIHVCTCVYAWDIAQSLGLKCDFAGGHTGWHDFLLMPDLATLRRAAWLDATAICLADSCEAEDGSLLSIAPRSILRRQLAFFDDEGWSAQTATELEFYLYWGSPADLRTDGFRSLRPTTEIHADYNITEGNMMEPFFGKLRQSLEGSRIPVELSQVEYGLGQWEINLEHTDPLEMADRHVLFKQAVRDCATRDGLTATFMPRPRADDLGSSCHVHLSLKASDGSSVFYDQGSARSVSATLVHAVGGVLRHAPELMCWYAPTINAYRRTTSQDFAGNNLTWGFDNRTVSTRVLSGSPDANRLEFRVPGADINPYLVLAGVMASAADGIKSAHDPGPPQVGDAYASGVASQFAETLAEAACAFRKSAFCAASFGKDVVEHFATVADFEWRAFLGTVTDWERDRYFDTI